MKTRSYTQLTSAIGQIYYFQVYVQQFILSA